MQEYKPINQEYFLDAAKNAQSRTIDGTECFFFFNDIRCIVDKNTDLSNLYKMYDIAFYLGWTQIGPANAPISKESIDLVNQIKKRNEQKLLSISQLDSFKKSAEQKIAKIISKFKDDTGLDIDKINLVKIDPYVPFEKAITINVQLEIHL